MIDSTDGKGVLKSLYDGTLLDGEKPNESIEEKVKNTADFLNALANNVGELAVSQITYLLGDDEDSFRLFQRILSSMYPCKEVLYRIELQSVPRNGVVKVKGVESIINDEVQEYERVELENSSLSCHLEFKSVLVPDTKVISKADYLYRSLDKDKYVIYIGVKNGIQNCFMDALERDELYIVINHQN